MPRGSGSVRYVPNPRMFGEIARSGEMHTLMMDASHRGAAAARAIAPEFTGPTWQRTVTRHGEYKASIYSAATLRPNGWRGEFGATSRWSLQVEFGTGGGSAEGRRRNRRGQFTARRRRPQKGWSPKARVLGRALESLRRSV